MNLDQRARFRSALVATALAVATLLPGGTAAAQPSPACQVDPSCDDFRPIFYQDRVPEDSSPQQRAIFRINPDGTGRTEIIRNATAPSVDRDRSRIAFVRDSEIWIANIDGSGQQRVTDRSKGGAVDVSLSPEGDYVAYHVDSSGKIVVQGLTNSSRCDRITDSEDTNAPIGLFPRWSPDGLHLAFILFGEEPGIGVMRCDGGDRRVLLRGATGAYLDWSADGRSVVYEGSSLMRWVEVQAPGAAHDIPGTGSIKDGVSASPDGKRIVIRRNTAANRGLWVLGIDGTGQVRIADIPDHSGRPDWGYPSAPVVSNPTS
ncbi:hypothetical protein [Pseudonocardia sp. TRM90224]|uniref:hypothetical protein n=1 Tax=Pseudonocardia sp. TRM90224 TaxID=2812678 RepID=UPI001E473AFF|nr:hypothetical protein [Pseudonocardia sp. TRM90224]